MKILRMKVQDKKAAVEASQAVVQTLPLWQLDIVEVTGHNLEARGREEVNRLLESGWRLLHIYTLRYHEDSVWRERPMGILGRLKSSQQEEALSDAALIGGPETDAPEDL
jgi:hypothetical protein